MCCTMLAEQEGRDRRRGGEMVNCDVIGSDGGVVQVVAEFYSLAGRQVEWGSGMMVVFVEFVVVWVSLGFVGGGVKENTDGRGG